MNIYVKETDKEMDLIKTYSEMKNISISSFIKKSILEKIEEEMDLNCYYNAMI